MSKKCHTALDAIYGRPLYRIIVYENHTIFGYLREPIGSMYGIFTYMDG